MGDWEPLGERSIIRPVEPEHESAGGVLIPDVAQERPQEGEVLTTGEESKLEVGDRVLFSQYGGTQIPGGLMILQDNDVLARKRED